MSVETQKPSRYRGLRGKSVSESRKVIEQVLGDSKHDQGKESSSSLRSAFGSKALRRRSKTLGNVETIDTNSVTPHFPVPLVPPIPTLPQLEKEHANTTRPKTAVKSTSPIPPSVSVALPVATAVTADTAVDGRYDPAREEREREEHTWREEQERQRRGEEEAARLADRLQAETDRILADQKRLDLARLHQRLLATQSTASLASSKSKSPVLEKFGFFSRGRRSQAHTLSPTSSTTASVDFSRAQSLEPQLSPSAFLELGGQLTAASMSPVSANHPHDRFVTVRYRGESVNVGVLLDTSTVDILFQCSDLMTVPIDTASSVVLECYTHLGLERRLRRYEHVRDVLNSWDRDTQNSLLIFPSSSLDGDRDLDISSVPSTEAPRPAFTLQLHHSSRPGKWNKRWVTLHEDGQMYSSKKAGPNLSDKEAQRLCHLSDCDIYTLMSKSASVIDEGQTKSTYATIKNLKPPKKYVYAVKSQQKTTTFPDTNKFVHFFCTDDPAIASKFSAQVQSWRSWYMVKARREAQRKRLMDDERNPAPKIVPVKHKPKKSVSHVKVSRGHRMRVSIDETPYSIGELQPLLDLERFNKPIHEFGKDWIPDPRQSALLLEAAVPGANPAAEPVPVQTPTGEVVVMTGQGNRPSQTQDRYERQAPQAARAPAEGGPQNPVDESQVGIAIAVAVPPGPTTGESNANANATAPSPPEPDRQSTEPEAQPRSWLPSASEHSARLKAEQERLERLKDSPPQQRPSARSGVTQSQSQSHSQRGGRGGMRTGIRTRNPNLSGNLVVQYRAVLNWADEASGDNGPMPSPKFLGVPGSNGRGVPPVPALPRQPSSAPSNVSRPSTSGGERDRAGGSQSWLRGRSGSVSSLRRGQGGIGGPPAEALPPMPPMPPHIRNGTGVDAGFGGRGARPGGPVMLGDVGRTLTARR